MNVRTVSRLHTQPLPPCRVKAVTRSLCSRRRCLIAFALDGPWAQQAYKGSNSSSSAPQEQLTSNPAPEPVSNEPLVPAASATASPNPASTSSSSQTTVSNSNSSASTPSSPAAASPGVTPSPTQQQQPSWESWCQYFDQQDQSGTKLDSLQPLLAAAISDEDYQAAAAIKSEISSLTSADAVAAIQQRLAAALAAEQYAEAAVLRDQGWALLEGWWACETTDAAGHLLKVSPEYGRWTGKAYTPREVVEMQTWAREQRAARRLGSSRRNSSSSSSSSRRVGGVSDVDRSSQLGTPIMEVFVRQQQDEAAAAVEAGQKLSSWESQAVVLQPAAANDQSAGAGAAARDADLEAEIGELFRSEVTRAVWGRSSLSDDTAAAAASGIALPGAPAGSSDAFAMSGSPFVKDDVMQSGDYSSGVTNPDQGMSNPASDYALVFGGQGSDHDREPWEELLDAAESALAAAAAAADQAGGVLCADGQIRKLNRQGLSAAAAADSAAAAAEAGNAQGLHDNARSEPVLQLLLEIVEGRDHVLLAARSVHGVTRSTSWTVCAMPSGPGMVPDWSLVTPDQVPEMRARLAASLEAQRVVREMQGARDGWWMNPYVWNAVFNLTGPAAVAAMQRQQQGPDDNAQDETTVPKDESPPDEFGFAWDDVIVGNDAAMRSGFYTEFYQDFGPGVEFPWLGDRYHPDERQQQLGPNDAFDFSVANSSSSSASSSSSSKVRSSPALADLAPAELEEVLETLEQLKNVTAASSSSSSDHQQQQQQQSSSHIVWSPPATVDLQQHKEQQDNTTRQQQQQQRGLRRKAPGLASSSRPSSSRWPAAAAAWRSSRTAAGSSSDQMDGTAVAVDELERHPGVVAMQGIDRFTLKPQMQPDNSSSSSSDVESSALSQQQQQQGEASTNKGPSRSRRMPRRSIYVIEVPSRLVDAEEYKQQQQQQHKAMTTEWRVDGVEDKGYDRVWQLAAHQVLLQHACTPAEAAAEAAASDGLTSTVAASTNAAAAAAGSPLPITWRQPLADLMSSRSNEVLSGGSDLDLECNVADTFEEEASKTLENEQETATASSSSTASSSGSSSKVLCVPADAPVLVLQLPQRLVDQVDESAAAANAAAAARERAAAAVQKPGSSRKLERQTAAAAAAEPDGLKYRRINHKNATTTDPMTGLYVGAFGPHGPEVIQLYRSVCEESGAETVVGLKLTGDANVPAGEVSFRAKIGRKHRLSTKGMFAPQLDIQARYPGEGRVAGPGFSNPRWVPGELLVFNSSSSSSSSGDDVINWTAGAQLGFVYDIPGQRRFCVLLNRISLE